MRRLLFVLALAFSLTAGAECWVQDVDVTVVCVEYAGGRDCWYQVYEYYYCEVGGTEPSGPSGPGGPGGGYPGSFYDSDANGVIDHWRIVVQTTDPCGDNFDTNDLLGENLGGSNTIRPNHPGVDIQGNLGDPVFSVFDGVVENVGDAGDCGYRVQIRNADGSHTTYCHMVSQSSPLRIGDPVWAGSTQIGEVDSTGGSTGHHLHITHLDQNYNNAGEYFSYVDTPPNAGEMNPGGC